MSTDLLNKKNIAFSDGNYTVGAQEKIQVEAFSFSELIDCNQLSDMLSLFYELVGLGISIIDNKNNILVAIGWQDVCTKFHRVHPETCKNCIESDEQIIQLRNTFSLQEYKCKNGMWDSAYPIVIEGKVVAAVYFGQYFYDDEEIDFGFYERQAEKYGFDKDSYISAIKKIPLVSRKKVKTLLQFYAKLAQLLADTAYQNLIIKRERINELLITQQKLIEKESQLKNAQALAKIGNWQLEVAENKLYWSDEIFRIFGAEPQSFEPSYELFLSFIHPDDKDIVNEAYITHLNTKQQYNIVHRIVLADGSIKHVNERCTSDFDENEQAIRSLGTVADITEQIMIQRALIEREEKLKQINADKDRFMSILAHDLKNPFNALLGFSDLLHKNIRTYDIDKIEKQIGIIHQAVHKTYNILTDLLLWSKAQEGKVEVQAQNLGIKSVCEEVIESLKQQAFNKGIEINCHLADEITIRADLQMLKIVLRNLISNAIKFTHTNGCINVDASTDSGTLTLVITDNGIGMNEKLLATLWDFNSHVSTIGTNDERGTGFGLLLCKEFVERNNGKIWAKSTEEVGSQFYFTLPLVETI